MIKIAQDTSASSSQILPTSSFSVSLAGLHSPTGPAAEVLLSRANFPRQCNFNFPELRLVRTGYLLFQQEKDLMKLSKPYIIKFRITWHSQEH